MRIPIDTHRLHNQRLTQPARCEPADVVSWLGAVQAQEFAAAKWGLALRMADAPTAAQIERAFEDGRILRTHVMRPTWHFVTASDIRWMLALTSRRVLRAMAYVNRVYELDAAIYARATRAFERALGRGGFLTRAELGTALARARIDASGVRLALMTMAAELEGVICSGPYRGKQLTYALLETRVPPAPRLPLEEALAKLTARYFTSHGPATIRDFVWWSGLTTVDARRGLDMIRARSETRDGRTYWTLSDAPDAARRRTVHLLPIYDEYLVAYRDRDAVPLAANSGRRFPQPLIIGGQVAGAWRSTSAPGGVAVEVDMRRPLTAPERRLLANAVVQYGRHLGLPASLALTPRVDQPRSGNRTKP